MWPPPSLPTESVRYRPTVPEELARPLGKNDDLEFRSSRADSQALAARTMAAALTRFSDLVALSIYETPVALPSLSMRISRAIAPVTSVRRPVAIAGGMRTWLELKLEAVTQPRPHCPQ